MSMEQQVRFEEESVVIHRDEDGFGFKVGGENPVFVYFVNENGAAYKAGVRKNDFIIKVNGTLVRSYEHNSVVEMIQNSLNFVNLTLHRYVVIDTFPAVSNESQSTESGNNLHLSSSSSSNLSSNIVSNNMKAQPLHQLLHNPHPISNSSSWLDSIGDDLFQDIKQKPQHNHQRQQQPQTNLDTLSVNPNAQLPVGVSKLIVSGPSPLTTSHNQQSGTSSKPKLRQNRNQSSTRENPYYYYKTVPEIGPDLNSCNSATSSLLSQNQGTNKSMSGLSMVRSRSSSKMSTRSTTGKYKPRNLRSRLVEDLRSLTINNSQTTPSSLSTSPSSSDLSDCDDQKSYRLDCMSLNLSNSSANSIITSSVNADTSGVASSSQVSSSKTKHTTRRLEIIRELIDTEKTHTERLKHLNDLLYKPIKAEGLIPAEQLKMVFSCHKSLFKIHRKIYKVLSATQQTTSRRHKEPLIGEALVEIFEGELGKRLEQAASTFCACQSTNTELLNRFTRKDTKAGEFLAQVANQQMLGRLGIKDLLASCFQRLTKYPLLLDNLLKATPTGIYGIHSKSLSEGSIATSLASTLISSATTVGPVNESLNPTELTTSNKLAANHTVNITQPNNNNDESTSSANTTLDESYEYERLCISRALYQSRQILIHVDEAVKRAVSHHKLRDIWKKTDKYTANDVINIESEQMLHEGPLTLRLVRRSFEVYVLLLTHYLVILTKEGQDRYKLKNFTAEGKATNTFSPIFNIDEDLAMRDTATDENGFYLLCKKKEVERIYEFGSRSPADRAKWKEKIHMAQMYNFAALPNDDKLSS